MSLLPILLPFHAWSEILSCDQRIRSWKEEEGKGSNRSDSPLIQLSFWVKVAAKKGEDDLEDEVLVSDARNSRNSKLTTDFHKCWIAADLLLPHHLLLADLSQEEVEKKTLIIFFLTISLQILTWSYYVKRPYTNLVLRYLSGYVQHPQVECLIRIPFSSFSDLFHSPPSFYL